MATNEFEKGVELGLAAFNAGKIATPALDSNLMAELSNTTNTIALLDGWARLAYRQLDAIRSKPMTIKPEDVPSIRRQMHTYRNGFGLLPKGYIELHEQYARADMPRFLEAHNLRSIATEMIDDGWCDGMSTLAVICRLTNGSLEEYRWSDSNGGSWFKRAAGGGQVLIEVPDMKPGHL